MMKELLECGLIHGHAMTVTGKTVAENLASVPRIGDIDQSHLGGGDERVLYSCEAPFAPPGHHLTVVKGSLAPLSAVVKLSGKATTFFEVCWRGGCPPD